jgi:hypothetical protein
MGLNEKDIYDLRVCFEETLSRSSKKLKNQKKCE